MNTPDTFALLPLHLVVPSPTNPRKTFKRDRMDELVASIKASGVHQPVLVRPLPGSCKDCPKRTGAAPDIFADVVGADICTDPPCYNVKAAAHLGALESKAIEAPAGKSNHTAASYTVAVQKIKASVDARVAGQYEELLELCARRVIIDSHDDEALDLIDHTVLIAHFWPKMGNATGDKALEYLGLDPVLPESLTRAQIYKFAALIMASGEVPVQEAIAQRDGMHLGRLRDDAKEQVKAEVAAEIAALKKPPRPTAPLAQPDTVPAADAKPKKPAPLRKPKLSAQDAQLGIAEAMQDMEEGAPAVAVESGSVDQVVDDFKPGPQASQPFTIGQRVRVNDDITIQTRQRFAGKTGTITGHQEGEFDWTVTFKGSTGGVSVFAVDEIQAVAT